MEHVLFVIPITTLMLAACWIIFVVHWLAIAGPAKPIQKKTHPFTRTCIKGLQD